MKNYLITEKKPGGIKQVLFNFNYYEIQYAFNKFNEIVDSYIESRADNDYTEEDIQTIKNIMHFERKDNGAEIEFLELRTEKNWKTLSEIEIFELLNN